MEEGGGEDLSLVGAGPAIAYSCARNKDRLAALEIAIPTPSPLSGPGREINRRVPCLYAILRHD